jgi:hypothetical protein
LAPSSSSRKDREAALRRGIAARLKGLPRRAKPTAVVAVSAGYVLLMGIVFLQAMNGVPLVKM